MCQILKHDMTVKFVSICNLNTVFSKHLFAVVSTDMCALAIHFVLTVLLTISCWH